MPEKITGDQAHHRQVATTRSYQHTSDEQHAAAADAITMGVAYDATAVEGQALGAEPVMITPSQAPEWRQHGITMQCWRPLAERDPNLAQAPVFHQPTRRTFSTRDLEHHPEASTTNPNPITIIRMTNPIPRFATAGLLMHSSHLRISWLSRLFSVPVSASVTLACGRCFHSSSSA